MKQNIHSTAVLFFLLYLITTSQTLARNLATKQGEEKPRLKEITSEDQKDDSMTELMGMEGCESGDEECMKRRVVAEAHLDYIYTQHHKP